MPNDMNTLNLTSSINNQSLTFDYNIAINSAHSEHFEFHMSQFPNIGRKNLVKDALFEKQNAVIVFSQDQAFNIFKEQTTDLNVDIYYPFKDRYAASNHVDNIKTILNNCICYYGHAYLEHEIKSSSYKLVTDGLINVVSIGDQVVFSTNTNYIADYEKIILPMPFCNYFSNPSVGHFSPHYQYANNTKSTCCSNKSAFPNADIAPVCPFSDHSSCSYYSADQVKIDSVSSIDNINSNETMLFELVKSRYTDSTLRYSVLVNSITALEQSHSLTPETQEQDIDDAMRTLFHHYIDDISHDKKPIAVSVDVSKKRSFISTIVK